MENLNKDIKTPSPIGIFWEKCFAFIGSNAFELYNNGFHLVFFNNIINLCLCIIFL